MGRKPASLDEILKVVVAYVAQCAPARGGVHGAKARTAVALDWSESTVGTYLTRARKVGLLSETVRGRGGGVLTARARGLLGAS